MPAPVAAREMDDGEVFHNGFDNHRSSDSDSDDRWDVEESPLRDWEYPAEGELPAIEEEYDDMRFDEPFSTHKRSVSSSQQLEQARADAVRQMDDLLSSMYSDADELLL
ncbi:hypothetical protein FBEOM_10740 [Fusarium beomiforme]|uniref:Uncharacterized protein n=1 Tax=Fusarium beomiforme TaxID=44412 RepID=A0A9P5ABR9_9HYPO|nr:hypothetical protein FBEOM_10740 [Fusarium beomiforme]